MQPWESQPRTQWLVCSKEEGMGGLALEFVVGSIDGQCDSPFPKEPYRRLGEAQEAI